MPNKGLREYLLSQEDWLRSVFYKILSVPSESSQETEMQKILFTLFSSLDSDCMLADIPEDLVKDPEYSSVINDLDYKDRYNLIIKKRGLGSKNILFNTHVDVVPPSEDQKNPYTPSEDRQGNIFARGACDAKGQIAVLLLLLKAAKEFLQLNNSIECHLVVEEEIGGNGTLSIVRRQKELLADAVINLEPTNHKIMSSIRGALWFKIDINGESGHSGSHATISNPINKAIEIIEIIKKYHRDLFEKSKNFGLFSGIGNPMPLTLGQIISGKWPSMVPDGAVLRGVLGFLPNMTKEKIIAELLEKIGYDKDINIKFDYRHNGFDLPKDHWVVKKMGDTLKKFDLDPSPQGMSASTDAIFYHESSLPVIAYGPGNINYAHSAEEHINIFEIIRSTEILITFINSIA